jgi:TolA-binding protein
VILVGLVAAGIVVGRRAPPDPTPLYELASRAYAGEQWAAAAEYARHALSRAPVSSPLRPELQCLRGESLLRAGDPRGAVAAFETVVSEAAGSPYVAQALFGLSEAQAAAGNEDGARRARVRLRDEYPDTPWARRAAPTPN